MAKTYEVQDRYSSSWYGQTANRLLMTQGSLKNEITCDVCIIGGGFTGLSAALELSEKGFSTVLLEANEMTASAPGRNGGHLLRGLGLPPAKMLARFGAEDAKLMADATLDGLGMIIARIGKHEITCDLKFGHLTAALKDRHLRELAAEKSGWDKLGHTDMRMISRKEIPQLAGAKKYTGGLFDPKGTQLHPLNYALGIAQGAQTAGCKIYDETPALSITHGDTPSVKTPTGRVNAKFLILAGAINTRGAEELQKSSVPATAYMIATEPLKERLASEIFPADIAITDARFIPDHYRLTADRRLLFGANHAGVGKSGIDKKIRQRMIETFPSLKAMRVDHFWQSRLDFTLNHLPHVGRLAPNIYFAHGFGGHGHGIICSNILGTILAEAVGGQAARFDVFAKIKHLPLGPMKAPLFRLSVLWDAVRDAV